MRDPATPADDGDFFVGYLKMGRSTRRFLLTAGAVLALAVVVGSFALSRSQPAPGGDLKPYQTGEEVRGFYVARPYPQLRTIGEDGLIHTILLVSQSKHRYDGGSDGEGGDHPVRVLGNLIERTGSKMMEVVSLDVPPDLKIDPRLTEVRDQPLGPVRLIGEIVDSKCYLGRMRPGSGRAHRACAQLCISGGIPPILVTRDLSGVETHYILCGADETPVNDAVIPFVAEPVQVLGDVIRRGDIQLLLIDPSQIRRL